jgi:hypothetical protein
MRAPRSAAFGALASLLLLATMAGGPPRPEATPAPIVNLRPAAAVAWPPSAGALIAEVVTGGASSSDEYVEITNAGAEPADLAGMELAYITSSGSSVTRKATWSLLTLLATGQHLLVANALGAYAATADATYSGGLAATGGSLVLRPIGGTPVDAVGWGDAANAFVEGAAATAPPAGQSIERRPGGSSGNVTDTNQNAADWAVLPEPIPQDRAAAPVPGSSAPPSPFPSPLPSPEQSPSPVASPTPTPTPSPDPTPTAIAPVSIAAARGAPDGTSVTVEGVLTTPLGVLEAGRGGFLQDGTAGIAIYAATAADPMAAGSLLRVTGVVDDRYGERTIRLAGPPTLLTAGPMPFAAEATTGAAVEPLEGLRLRVHGPVVDAPTILADGPAVTLDDGSGPLRIIFAGSASASVPARGSFVSVAGSLGQRDSSGTGTTGYRLFVVDPLDLIEEPAPSPSPTPTEEPGASATPDPGASATPDPSASATPDPSATPTPSPTPSPAPSASPSPAPSPTPTPTGEPATIAVARSAAIGTTVRVRGVVTAEPGRVGLPPLGVLADESGGIFVRFPDGVAPARGALLDVVGRLADPYGQLEIRPVVAGVRLIGVGPLAVPLPIGAASLSELVEARLVMLDATLDAAIVREPGGDLVLRLLDVTGAPFRARATRTSGLEPSVARRGDRLRLVGVVGQRASARGALDGYRLWLRDAGDVTRPAGVAPSPTPMPSPVTTPRPWPGASDPPAATIAAALGVGSGSVAVEGTVSVSSTLLDATGRRSLVQDATAAVEFLVPRDAPAPRPGDRVRVVGALGRAYGAPRITAATLIILGHAAEPAPTALAGPPSAGLEWRLVAIEGTVADQRRLGDRWRAELGVAGGSVPVAGLPGAGIPASALAEGSRVRIVGIVRRPNPAATDQHFVIVPRSPADIRVLARATGPAEAARPGAGASRPGTSPTSQAFGRGGAAGGTTAPVSADAAGLARLAGRSVRVGGLVVAVDATGLVLDDGTGSARLDLAGDARSLLALLGPGDAVGAAGVVQAGTPPAIRVTDAADLVRLGDLGEALPLSDEVVPADGVEVLPSDDPGARSWPVVASPDTVAAGSVGDAAFAPMTAGAGSICALATAGAMLVVVRRRRDRRIVRARIARRIAELRVPLTAASTPDEVAVAGDPAPLNASSGPIMRESA